MIVVTGAAGFIGSCFVSKLNMEGHKDIICVDEFSRPDKNKNLENKEFYKKVDRKDFLNTLHNEKDNIKKVVHLGARTDTTEFDKKIFDELNLNYSKSIWEYCSSEKIPLIYASSAATYGAGEHGYSDNHDCIKLLKPLNPYGESKNDFDKWALQQKSKPPMWAGLKFFNVFGPNEYHKSRMASVVFHAYNQIKETGSMKLFRSHKCQYKDGEQLRDFIYVKDVVNVIYHIMSLEIKSGIYNLGTGNARTFLDLAKSVFKALNIKPDISFIDTPADIREKYQYFTEAKMDKLKNSGYNLLFTNLETGVEDYVNNYLEKNRYY